MPHKDPEVNRRYRREYHKRWYELNRDDVKQRVYANPQRINRRKNATALIEAAKNRPCQDCGCWFDPTCMEFDHRDPGLKVTNVSKMRRGDYSLAEIQAEIDKCDLVCACCHRIRTKYRATVQGLGWGSPTTVAATDTAMGSEPLVRQLAFDL